MKHARTDYDRIQDPAVSNPSLLSPGSTPIGENEPVFLIRGRDVYAPLCLQVWAAQAFNDGDLQLAYHVQQWAVHMQAWQRDNGSKKPDAPAEVLAPINF